MFRKSTWKSLSAIVKMFYLHRCHLAVAVEGKSEMWILIKRRNLKRSHLAARQMARKEGWLYLCPRPHVRSWMPPLSLPSAITSLPKASLAQSSASHAEYLICEHTLEVGCLFLISSAITFLRLFHRVLPLMQIYHSPAWMPLCLSSAYHLVWVSSISLYVHAHKHCNCIAI